MDYQRGRKRSSFYEDGISGKTRLVLFSVILLLSVGIMVTAGWLFRSAAQIYGSEQPPDPDSFDHLLAASVAPTPTPQPDGETDGETGEEAEQLIAQGPYGLRLPTLSPTPTIVIEPGDEIWMPDFVDTRTPVVAKGIYVTADYAKGSQIDELIALLDRTELNTMVIDIKADSGYIVYNMDDAMAKEIGATTNIITNIDSLVKKLKEHGVYLIARMVAFKDPVLAKARPDLCFYNKDGSKFYDSSGAAWVSPFKEEVWEYLTGVAVACAQTGFDEINFDYIRFPTDGVANLDYGPEAETMTKSEAVTAFTRYVSEHLREEGVYVSADVYGTIINSSIDAAAVGQDYVMMSRYLDYICPMIYPSHYADGYAGIEYPDLEPYKIIKLALDASTKKLATIKEYHHRADVRPWLQDFTASYKRHYMVYDAEAVRAEINAVYDCELTGWLLWNAGVVYTEGALLAE